MRHAINLAANPNPARPGPSRTAVEKVLKAANGRPLSAVQVADLSGVAIDIAKTHISNACSRGDAHNLRPGSRNALYVWGAPPKEEKPVMPLPRQHIPQGCYIPKPIPTRPGSDDFLKCHSRRGDELVPHRGPITLGVQ